MAYLSVLIVGYMNCRQSTEAKHSGPSDLYVSRIQPDLAIVCCTDKITKH